MHTFAARSVLPGASLGSLAPRAVRGSGRTAAHGPEKQRKKEAKQSGKQNRPSRKQSRKQSISKRRIQQNAKH